MLRLRRLAPVFAFFWLAAACGSDSPYGGPGGPGGLPEGGLVEGIVVEVDSPDNFFRAAEIEVEAGTEVVWTNTGRNVHNVILSESKEILIATSDFGPGDVGSHRFIEPGTFRYYCSIHGTADAGMIGVVEVVPAGVTP